jgi:hypothetical protein
MSRAQIEQIVRAVSTLPPEKTAEVYDFVLFLQARYGQPAVDSRDTWSRHPRPGSSYLDLRRSDRLGGRRGGQCSRVMLSP